MSAVWHRHCREASADMPHLGDVDEPEGRTSQPVTATAGLLPSLRTVAPVSGAKRRWGDYFELAGTLQHGFYPMHPFRLGPSYMVKRLYT